MVWVSAKNLILNRCVFLWTLSYFLLWNPEALYSNFITVAIGHHLPQVYDFGTQLEGFVAVLLFLFGLQDFCLLFHQRYLEVFRTVVPTRLLVMFFLGAASYQAWTPLAVGPVFSFCFIECLLNFWLFTTIREEMNEQAKGIIRESRGMAPDVL